MTFWNFSVEIPVPRSITAPLLRAKWVTTALVLSLSVGTMSVYVIHEISDRIVSNLDRNEFRHTFSHYIVLRNRHEDAYFDIRQRWRQGELQDVTAMIPVIEGSVEVKGRLVPVLGLDMLANFSDSEIYAGSQTSLDALLAGNTVISYGGALDADAEFLGARVVEASLEGRNFLLADITTAQAIYWADPISSTAFGFAQKKTHREVLVLQAHSGHRDRAQFELQFAATRRVCRQFDEFTQSLETL